jgi:hypothetical protein
MSARGVAPAAWLIAALTFVVHVATSGRYGWFRDELYFIACGHHLAWGFVDQPPVIAVLARVASIGGSLFVFRLPAALAHAALVWLVALTARRMGGGAFAQVLAALATAVAPILLVFGHVMTMNAFEPLAWLGAALVVLAIVDGADARWWILGGAIIGVGVLDKHSVAFFAIALVVGLVATPERRTLASRWFVAALALAVLIVLPHVAWQVAHGWPMLELLRHGQQYKNQPVSVREFFVAQIVLNHPLTAPIWALGLWRLLREPRLRPLGVAAVTLLAMMIAMHAKIYYAASLYPLLFAAGGVAVESLIARVWMRGAAIALVAAGGALLAPLWLPILPVPALLRYQAALHFDPPRTERLRYRPLSQIFADEHGWRQLEAAVARVYRSLPADEQPHASIFAQNYGEAGAIDFFGARDGLPPATAGHNSYYTWGPPRGEVLITVGGDASDYAKDFFEVVEAARLPPNPWVMPYEDELRIFIARGPRRPIDEIWPSARHYE